MRVVAELTCRGIQPMQAPIGRQPHDARAILADVPNRPEDTVRTIRSIGKPGDRFSDRIESLQRFVGADPEKAGAVLENEVEKASGRIVRVGGITTVRLELIAVVPAQHVRGIEPQEALIVLKDVADLSERQAVLAGQMGKTDIPAFGYGKFHQLRFPLRSERRQGKECTLLPPAFASASTSIVRYHHDQTIKTSYETPAASAAAGSPASSPRRTCCWPQCSPACSADRTAHD